MGIVEVRLVKEQREYTYVGCFSNINAELENFVEGGTFLPNLPLLRHIRAEVQQNENIIDFANGELGCNLYPHDQLQTILREQPLTHSLSYDHPQAISRLDKR